jgi:hypothetical protein
MAGSTVTPPAPAASPFFASAGGGVSFLFHAAEIKPRNGMTGEKISPLRGLAKGLKRKRTKTKAPSHTESQSC